MKPGYSLDSDETVIREVRGHWIALMPVLVLPAILIGVGFALVYGYARYRDQLSFIPTGAVTLLLLIFFLLGALIFAVGSFVYRQNKLVLTDKHLILIKQNGLFSRTVSQLNFSRVQDVDARRQGVLATIFNFGTIEVETAGEEENFTFDYAPKPQQLADQCLAVHDRRPEALPESPAVPTDNPDL